MCHIIWYIYLCGGWWVRGCGVEDEEAERGGWAPLIFFIFSALSVSSAIRSLRDTTGAGEGGWTVFQGLPGGERGREEERGGVGWGQLLSEEVCRLGGRERGEGLAVRGGEGGGGDVWVWWGVEWAAISFSSSAIMSLRQTGLLSPPPHAFLDGPTDTGDGSPFVNNLVGSSPSTRSFSLTFSISSFCSLSLTP